MERDLGQKVKLELKYGVLNGGTLKLYEDVPPSSEYDYDEDNESFGPNPNEMPKSEYIVWRKQCLLAKDPSRL